MPNANNPLPIKCPKCDHNGGRLVVKSITVMTVKCASCAHFWATDLRSLSPEIQEKVHAMLREL